MDIRERQNLTVQVGSPDWVPTTADLEKIKAHFNGHVVIESHRAVPTLVLTDEEREQIEVEMSMCLPGRGLEPILQKMLRAATPNEPRTLLHLEVGRDDWTPTIEELEHIVGLFQHPELATGRIGVCATLFGTKVNVLETSPDQRIVKAQVIVPNGDSTIEAINIMDLTQNN